ncbi:hypothetical protein [Mycobacterium heckeshornense]|uniref:hypothetical protein n=1 Tax=Mycobacterium heckeshornense TaxID=110505 RepID=UPI000B10F42F|nr:hypothetical protein [Mycobacterium heckeshornense]MCV7033276.1 hypothetical protein [Mycobacterium heckeshornense]
MSLAHHPDSTTGISDAAHAAAPGQYRHPHRQPSTAVVERRARRRLALRPKQYGPCEEV